MMTEFQKWMGQVDRQLSGKIAVDSGDMPDLTWFDWFEDGLSPTEGVAEALQKWEDDRDLPEGLGG